MRLRDRPTLRALAYAFLLTGAPSAAEQEPLPAEVMPLAAESLLLAAAADSEWAVVVGERGHVLTSRDFETWQQAENVPVSATLTAVARVGDRVWAVGHDGAIVASDDRGATWRLQRWAPEDEEPLLDVLFLDNATGIATGAYGLMLVTADGGDTWERAYVSEEDDFHLNAIVRVGEQGLFIAAEAGVGYLSDDLGETWEAVDMPYDGSMFGVVSGSDGQLVAFGLRGNMQVSDDGGRNWSQVETGTTRSLMGGVAGGDGVLLVGANGQILAGKDVTSLRDSTHPDGETLASVARIDNARYLLVGQGGVRVWAP